MTKPRISLLDLALAYHSVLPTRIRHYVNARGIPDLTIDRFMLGWNGRRITIPIYNRDGEVVFFKQARDPERPDAGAKMLASKGSRAELYGWERVTRAWRKRLIICEGEFDRLVLESRGFAAVTSTAGAGVFKKDWAEALRKIPEVFLCFDRDEAGLAGALRVARMVPGARVVELPAEVGDSGDITDFFVRLGKPRSAFLELLAQAERPPSEERPKPRTGESTSRNAAAIGDAAKLKALVQIEDLIRRRLPLRHRGANLAARCPFHEDRTPSFVVFPETQTFHCFGCGAHGDAIEFLRRSEGIGFREALDRLRGLAA